MGMNVGGKKGGAIGDINVTPLVDVVLVLLIIFMVITQMLASGVEVKLPKARTSESAQDVGQHIVIGIKAPSRGGDEPRVYIDRSQTDLVNLIGDLNQVYKLNPGKGLLIKGSKKLKWKEAYKVMNTINEGGMNTMLLATDRYKTK
jgi:biopolymer transport protein TolR